LQLPPAAPEGFEENPLPSEFTLNLLKGRANPHDKPYLLRLRVREFALKRFRDCDEGGWSLIIPMLFVVEKYWAVLSYLRFLLQSFIVLFALQENGLFQTLLCSREVGIDSHRLGKVPDSFVKFVLSSKCRAERHMCLCIVRLDSQHFRKVSNGFVEFALLRK
jgi:hypothetical protein